MPKNFHRVMYGIRFESIWSIIILMATQIASAATNKMFQTRLQLAKSKWK